MKNFVAMCDAITGLAEPDALTVGDGSSVAVGCTRERVSKFQHCLSERLELDLLAEALTDVEGGEDER